MSEKSLLSLREIAGELQLNYRMIINYKNQLQILLPAKYDGQFNKYPSECTDLFRLVSVLRDEGYTFEMIRAVLSGAGEAPEDNEINEWVMIWKEKLDQSGSIQINPDQSRLAQINPDQSGAEEINPDQSESIQTNLGQSGLVEINPEQSRLIQDEIAAELEEKIESQKVVFQNILEATLSDLTAQVNGALTQYYKAIAELQLEYKDLHSRLAHLEKELGATPPANPVLIELDLESMQIKLEKPEPVLQHATMEFVKASISDGKPDKLSVVQWIQAEREKNPSVSYAELAEMLDQAGVPTLRGSVGWHRGTIRNLTIKP